MKVMIAPISGSYFPTQLAIISELCDAEYKSDFSMGTSGGNLALYIMLASDRKSNHITRISRTLSASVFMSNWWPRFLSLPSWIIGFFKGSSYNAPKDINKFFSSLFNSETIGRHEIITGTTNIVTGKSQFFSNTCEDKSFMKGKKLNLDLLGCNPMIYMDEKVDNICSSAVASASIPAFVPPVVINKEKYLDGGILYASPMYCFQQVLPSMEDENNPGLHITYVSSADLRSCDNTDHSGDMIGNIRNSTSQITKSLCIQDRYAAISLLRLPKKKIHFLDMKCNVEKIKMIEKCRLKARRSVTEYYPKSDDHLLISSFTGKDVVDLIEKTKSDYYVRIWWVGSKDIFNKLKKECSSDCDKEKCITHNVETDEPYQSNNSTDVDSVKNK